MPLPYRPGTERAVPEWRFRDIYDESFLPVVEEYEEDGQKKTRESMGFVTVALRPLFDYEVDKVERSDEYLDFLARHFTGGFTIDTPDGKEIVKDPMPLIVDRKPVPLDENHVLVMFRIEAMQKPEAGQGPPKHPEGKPVEFVSVREMVESTVRGDLFWKGLQRFMADVWEDGQRGKGFRRTAPTSDAPPAA